ncbi:glycoside hydrolase family 3 protein [Candidatus Pelagibacter sp.]|nr:glycoside hydrolase family 3 protein [Candidatus Pelagibacter sp.]
MMNKRRSFIMGIRSTKLNIREKRILIKFKPWGVILFSRNIKSILQAKKLTNEIKKIFKDKNYPILIDQEGGRVNRLKNFFNADLLTGDYFGLLYERDKKKFNNYYKIFVNKTSNLLKLIGVNINNVPVLDIRVKGSSNIIGDRSFSSTPKVVSKIGDICINNFHKNNIGTVIKHIPGHGLAKVDSHKLTPIVKAKLKQLIKSDFLVFKNKKSLLAMTAHIIYEDIDPSEVATHSQKVISLIRNNIKFTDILMSDDISMKSLKYSIKQNTIKAFSAGCNLVLHCNGNYKELLIVAENSPLLSKFLIKKTYQLYKVIS